MKSRVLMSMLVIALAALMIGGATMAWFTDEAAAEPQTFTAGTLMVDIDSWDLVNTNDVNLENLNPGDEFSYDLKVKNSGSKRFYYQVGICWEDILGEEREDIDFDGRGYGTAPLSDIMEFIIKDGDGNELTSGTLENKTSPLFYEIPEMLQPDEIDSYTIEVKLPTTAENEYQGSRMRIAFVVLAKQIHPEAEYPEFVCPLNVEQPVE